MNRLIGQLLVYVPFLGAGFAEGAQAWNWTLQNGFDGSEILSMATDGGLLLAATRNRGVYRSADSGKTWQPPESGALRLHFLEFDSTTHRFYGLGDSTLYAADSQAREWTRLTDLVPESFGIGNTARFSVHGRVLILLNSPTGGVKVSRDGGRTWRTTNHPTVGFDISSVLAADSCVYATDRENPVSVSCDGGATWRFVGGDSTMRYVQGLARHQGAVLAATGYGIFSSGDQGRTWVPRNGIPQEDFEPGNSMVRGLKTKGNAIYAIKLGPGGSPGKSTYYRSKDGGSSWTAILDLASDAQAKWIAFNSMEFAEIGSLIFLASERGVLRSADMGVTWNRVRGLGDAEILSLAVQGRHTLALTGKGIFVTADSGATWEAALPNDATATWTTLSGGIGLYAVLSREGQVRVSSDSGSTWKPIPLPAQGHASHVAVVGGNLFLVSAGGLWRSGPDGSAWAEVPLPAADSIGVMAGGSRSLLLCARTHVWEFREDGGFINRNGSLASFDIPRAWMLGEDAYAVIVGDLHLWEAANQDWRRITGYSGYSYSLAGRGSRIIVGTNISPQVSLDGGRSWEGTPLAQSFPHWSNSTWLPLTFALDGNQVYGGDGSGGLWKLDPAFLEPPTATRGRPGHRARGRGATGILPRLEAWKVRLDGRAF